MRVLFSGSRHWTEQGPVEAVINTLPRGTTVVHGGARGLDSLAGMLAVKYGFNTEVYRADWSRHGKAAGPIRNQQMVDAGADRVFAFPLPDSRGTWDLVRRASNAGLDVVVYNP